MKYPKRPDKHTTEAASWRLLQSIAPEHWIVREVSERDYGIDAYIELVSKDGQITGQLISVQLKGVEKIDWKSSAEGIQTATSPSIKTTTAAYWLGLPVPVFLFVADLSAQNIYFVAAQEAIRVQFNKLDNQDTITFPINDYLDLTTDYGKKALYCFYTRESLHSEFTFHITNLINQIQVFGDFIRMNQNRDIFMEVEAERHMQFRALHEACRMAALYLGHEWPLESLPELYRMDREEWKEEYVYLHEKTLDYALQKIEVLFPALVRKAIVLVSQTQASYWHYKDPVFFSMCSSGELEWAVKAIEAETGT